jgi:hypothetical protein
MRYLAILLLLSIAACGDINGYVCKQTQSKEAECQR